MHLTNSQISVLIVRRSRVIDDLREEPQCLTTNTLYYYCDYAQPMSTVSEQIYSAYLKQAIIQGLLSNELERELVEKYSMPSSKMYESDVLNTLFSIFETVKPTIIILDGIDECEVNAKRSLTDFIKRCSTFRPAFVKILFTCRDEDPILHGLIPCQRIHLESRKLAVDMDRFIKYSVRKRIELGELTVRDRRLESDVVAALLAKAEGM